VIANVVDWLSQ